MPKYFVSVTKTITEHWKVEAEDTFEAKMFYDKGEKTSEKEGNKTVLVYED